MARLNSYSLDTTVSKDDKLIGTDASGSGTKNFNLESVANFLNTSSLINVNGQVIYKFKANKNTPDAGEFVIHGGGGGVNFNSITRLIFNHRNSNNDNIANYLSYFNGLFVMLTQTDNQNNFAQYSATVSSNQSELTDFFLTFREGNGTIENDKFYALSFSPKGQTDKDFVSNNINFQAGQAVTINHNLNKFPSVTVVDTAGSEVIGAVDHLNTNSLTITFNSDFTAKVHAN